MLDKKNNKGFIGIIFCVIILIIIVWFTNIKIEKWSNIGNYLEKAVMPIQTRLLYIKNKFTKNNNYFKDLEELKTENQDLRNKNTELEKSLRELEMIKAENSTLKEFVNLKKQYPSYETKPAYIIQKDYSNFSNIITIDIGKKDGIEVNMTVISEKGLVGHIISVSENSAKVQTIIDTSSSVSASIKSTKEAIVVKGTLEEDGLKASFIPTEASIIEGDKLETSGIGGIYPKGIFIGTIDKIVPTKNITDRFAYIEPAVDFEKLETVLVIIN